MEPSTIVRAWRHERVEQHHELAMLRDVAFARQLLEAGTVDDGDRAIAVTDAAGGVQALKLQGDRRAVHAERVGDALLRELDPIGIDAILQSQQPPREPVADRMQASARSDVRDLAKAAGAVVLEGPFLDFLDPWGNRIQVVEYRDVQFTKAPEVLRAMGLDLGKSAEAQQELAHKGIQDAPVQAVRE